MTKKLTLGHSILAGNGVSRQGWFYGAFLYHHWYYLFLIERQQFYTEKPKIKLQTTLT